jgi:hypothetical protein
VRRVSSWAFGGLPFTASLIHPIPWCGRV